MSDKKKPITVASRKAKGRSLQAWACQQVSEVTGIEWGNTDDHEIRSRQMGQSGPDVIMSPNVRTLLPFTIECKNQKQWSIRKWVEQAKTNCYPDTDWLLVIKSTGRTKAERTEEIVVLDANVFFELVKKIERS